MQWLLARFDPADRHALVLAAKGGHNDEMHNQNDVGTFIDGIHGKIRVGFDPGQVTVRLERHEDIEFAHGLRAVNRIVFGVREPVQQGMIWLEIVPV